MFLLGGRLRANYHPKKWSPKTSKTRSNFQVHQKAPSFSVKIRSPDRNTWGDDLPAVEEINQQKTWSRISYCFSYVLMVHLMYFVWGKRHGVVQHDHLQGISNSKTHPYTTHIVWLLFTPPGAPKEKHSQMMAILTCKHTTLAVKRDPNTSQPPLCRRREKSCKKNGALCPSEQNGGSFLVRLRPMGSLMVFHQLIVWLDLQHPFMDHQLSL